jgi:hypothetical protein
MPLGYAIPNGRLIRTLGQFRPLTVTSRERGTVPLPLNGSRRRRR